MKVRVNERKPSMGLAKVFEKSRNSSYREFFLPKLLCDGQGTGEFVRVLETFEFSSNVLT